MIHHTSHAPLSNDVTLPGHRVRSIVWAAAALACVWLLLQAATATAYGAAPAGDSSSCRVRYAIITLRQGPGFPYAQVRPPLKRNAALAVVGRSEKPKWLLVETETGNQGWALVDQLQCDPLPELPMVEAPPEPKPTPRPSAGSGASRGRPLRDRTSDSADGTDPAAESLSGDASLGVPDLPDIRFFIQPDP